MIIELHLPPEAERQLLVVAQKASGQDKPSQLQINNTFGALANFALKSAYNQVNKPEPVTKPLDITLPVAPDVRRGIPLQTPNPS